MHPKCIRSDNSPEFIASNDRSWLKRVGVQTLYIEPGSPWENGYAESFHSRFRDEFLAMEEFETLKMAGAQLNLEGRLQQPLTPQFAGLPDSSRICSAMPWTDSEKDTADLYGQ